MYPMYASQVVINTVWSALYTVPYKVLGNIMGLSAPVMVNNWVLKSITYA